MQNTCLRYVVALLILPTACSSDPRSESKERLRRSGVHLERVDDGHLVATIPFDDGTGRSWKDSDFRAVVADLRQLSELDTLVLDLIQISDDGMSDVASIIGLRHLKLRNTNISDKGIRVLSDLTNLETLELDHSRNIRGSEIASLASLPLAKLSLRATSITDETTHAIRDLKHLKSLDVGMTGISDETLKSVALLPRLCTLAADGTRITDVGVLSLSSASQLKEVGLSSNPQINAAAIREICRLPSLRTLDLLGSGISPEEMSTIRNEFPTVLIWYSPTSGEFKSESCHALPSQHRPVCVGLSHRYSRPCR